MTDIPVDATQLASVVLTDRFNPFIHWGEQIYLSTDSTFYHVYEKENGYKEIKILAPEEVKEWIAKVRKSGEEWNSEKDLEKIEKILENLKGEKAYNNF